MSTPTIVGTVNFQVDVQQVTTVSELGQASIVGPSLIRLRDGRYRLYLQARAYGSDNNADGVNIVSLISTDGIQWDVEPGTRISHGSESDVDSEAGEPGVYLGLDGKYYMAYTGRYIGANPDGVNQKMHRVVFAVSDDGLNWTKLNQHYTGSYDDAWTGFASSADVHIVNGQYVIYYTSGRKIIRAASQDGLIWVRQEIAIAAGHDSTMVEYDGVYYMFVMMPEGLEYERNPDTTRDNLVMAISQDGVNWSKDYYQVIVENGDGSQVGAVDLQDPAAILLSDGSLRIFLNNDGGKGIYSIKPTTALPKLAPSTEIDNDGAMSTATTPAPVKAALMQSLPVDVSAVLSAGPIANSLRTFAGFGMPKPHDPNQRIPQWEFTVPLGTPALSPILGTVFAIHTLWSDDWTVMIRGDQGDWIWEVEHVMNVEVNVGERVEAGQKIATASDFPERIDGKGFAIVELGLLEGGRVPTHHCPLLYIDQTVLLSITAGLDAIRQENLQRLDRQGLVSDPVNDPYGQACWTHDPILDYAYAE
jgi:predicted GH43/DUF377 family glycosyl hydrolase